MKRSPVRFRVVGLLFEALAIGWANLPVLLAMSLLAELPLFLVESFWGRREYPQYPGMIFLCSLAFTLRAAFAVHLVVGDLDGRRTATVGSLGRGIVEVLDSINMMTVFSAIQWAAFAAILFPAALLTSLPGVVVVARAAFLFVSLWVVSAFGMCIPLSIQERTSEPGSLRHSALLSRGHRGELAVLLGLFAGLELGAKGLIASAIARHLVLAVIGALGAPVPALVYSYLRRAQESHVREELVSVFD